MSLKNNIRKKLLKIIRIRNGRINKLIILELHTLKLIKLNKRL